MSQNLETELQPIQNLEPSCIVSNYKDCVIYLHLCHNYKDQMIKFSQISKWEKLYKAYS